LPPRLAPPGLTPLIRKKIADPDLRKATNADDLVALEAFYRTRLGAPLWMTDMGFSARGQQALFEIEKAGDWGLERLNPSEVSSLFDQMPRCAIPTQS